MSSKRKYSEIEASYGEEAVVLREEGQFYAVLGPKAEALHEALGLTYCTAPGSDPRKTRVGVRVERLESYKTQIAELGYLVVVVTQEENMKMKRQREMLSRNTPVRRFVESVDTISTLRGVPVPVLFGRDDQYVCTTWHPDTESMHSDGAHLTRDDALCRVLGLDPHEVVLDRGAKHAPLHRALLGALPNLRVRWMDMDRLDATGTSDPSQPAARRWAALFKQRPVRTSGASTLLLRMDSWTRRNVGLVTPRSGARGDRGLAEVLDACRTSAGSVLLRDWLTRPLANVSAIEGRLDAIEAYVARPVLVAAVRAELPRGWSLDVALRRVDAALRRSRDGATTVIPTSESLRRWEGVLVDVADAVRSVAAVSARGIEGLSATWAAASAATSLMRAELGAGASDVAEFSAAHKQARAAFVVGGRATARLHRVRGVVTLALPVGHAAVPDDATLESQTKTERRFVTAALRAAALDDASEARLRLEARCDLAEGWLRRLGEVPALRALVVAMARADLLTTLATRYRALGPSACVRPRFGRAPRFEGARLPSALLFAADGVEIAGNDLDWSDERRVLLLTGANGSGKSSFLRAAAINQILAQCGLWCFASRFDTRVVDCVGLRFGASDALVQGVSSLLGELRHADLLCRTATSRSMLFFDEFAQSTDASSGAALCAATLRFLAGLGCRAVFATHYSRLATTPIKGVAPHTMSDGFQVVPGTASSSEALRVAAAVGLPESLLAQAASLLSRSSTAADVGTWNQDAVAGVA